MPTPSPEDSVVSLQSQSSTVTLPSLRAIACPGSSAPKSVNLPLVLPFSRRPGLSVNLCSCVLPPKNWASCDKAAHGVSRKPHVAHMRVAAAQPLWLNIRRCPPHFCAFDSCPVSSNRQPRPWLRVPISWHKSVSRLPSHEDPRRISRHASFASNSPNHNPLREMPHKRRREFFSTSCRFSR
ncbi:hypothetical protein TRVL_07833 [Trypanosoma vivax]|nr:hypothetical protein TRVL_07833 [Trypanosoma vivax]